MVRVPLHVLLQTTLPLGAESTAGAVIVLSPGPVSVDILMVVPQVLHVHPARPAPMAALGGRVILKIRGYW